MNDKQLIEYIAEIWIENGGDSEGFVYNWFKIKECIEKVEEETESIIEEIENETTY